MLRKFQARLILCESDDERKDIVETVDVVSRMPMFRMYSNK